MRRKNYYLAAISLLILLTSFAFTGCSEKLEEPVFVKELTCSVDMDAEVEFITNNNFKLEAVDIEIPDTPDGISVDFYDEEVEQCKGYELHCLNFGIGTDNLNDYGGLSEPFIFHEIIVKWDDGSETRADIGTIHMLEGYEQAFSFDWESRNETYPNDETIEVVQDHQATKDLVITKVEIPYYDEYEGFIKDITIGGKTPSEITEDNPLVVEKGHTYMLHYTVDTTVPTKYGTMFVECKIIGTDNQGNEHINMFYIKGNENREMPHWMIKQIEKAE